MKKFSLVITIITLFFNSTINAQAFHKGAIVVDLGIAANVSKTAIQDEYNTSIWNGSSISNVRLKKDTTNWSAAMVYPVTVEYGVKNWLGIAGRFAYSKYLSSVDSVSGAKALVRGLDAGLILNLHIIKTNRIDIPIGVTFGYSNFKMANNDSLQSMAKDNGINYGFSVVPRIYFGSHIGLSLNLGYMAYTYPSLLFSNKNDSNLNNNNDRAFSLKTSGTNIGVGLIIKI